MAFEAADVPCTGPLHFSHIDEYEFCPLLNPYIGPSVLVGPM